MKNKFPGITALGLIVAALGVAAIPARADNVDERIQALEGELARLKSEQAQVKAEQIEMRKDATAAAAALPEFSYRTGSGLMIEAPDKAWSFRATIAVHMRLLFESGLSEAGRETGGILGRRVRPFFYYCLTDCLYEAEVGLDLDGFGGGNGKNSQGTGVGSILQRAAINFHLDKLNPWLPTFTLGMDGGSEISSYRRGSSSTGAQLEYDLLSRNNGFNTGRWGNGFALNWQDVDLASIGIPGRLPAVTAAYANIGEGDDGLQSFREQRSTALYFNIEPFSKVKNKWISGLGWEMGAWFCPNNHNRTPSNPQDVACEELRIRDNGDGGRQSLFRADVNGSGMSHFLMPGFAWTVGPYRFRAVTGFQRYDKGNSDVRGNVFLLGHDLFLWSPKGFLTGSSSTPGSILFGTHFERTDASCQAASCNNGTNPSGFAGVTPGAQQFHRNRILVREWDLWYFIQNRMSVGMALLWYDASNVRTASSTSTTSTSGIQGSNNVARNLGCTSPHQKTLERPGKGCDWVDFSITWRYVF